ncbi:MAG TPA: alpha/beta hydrolase [Solimonas sp.]|nr:alpha/beta hydrolase [Solimonas sp.]
MSLASWQAAGKSFDFNGHPIFYREHGSGETALVCVHGFPTASWDWEPLWPELCKRFAHVVAPDMLGFGFSAKPRNHVYSLVEQMDLHAALLAHLGVTRVHLLAHDYGVSVAQEWLARDLEQLPPDLLSVVLLNGGLFPETHRATSAQRLLKSPLGPLMSLLLNEQSFGRSFVHVFGSQTRPGLIELQDFWQLVAYNGGNRISHKLIRYIKERRLNRERWVGALQQTQVPLRLVNGPADPVSGAHMVERYRELVPDADVVLLKGIGHYPQVEAPDRVLRAFNEFHDKLRTPWPEP